MKRFLGALALSIGLLAFAAPPSMAGPLDAFMTAAAPSVIDLIGLALTGIIGWAAAVARKKWGIDIEAKHREALHSALFTGAQLALKQNLTGKAALDLILRYIRESVPDAIGGLGATKEVLTDLAKAKIEEVAQAKAKEATGAAVDALTGALKKIGLPAV